MRTEHDSSLVRDGLGEGASISFEYVDELPVLRSGKRKYIENLYRGGVSCVLDANRNMDAESGEMKPL